MTYPTKADVLAALDRLDMVWNGYGPLKEIVRAVLKAHLSDGWLPIETAPVNESVLIWIPNTEHYGDPVYRGLQVDMGAVKKRWQVSGLHMGRDLGVFDQPTHWRPLPAAPQPQREVE